MDMEHFTRRMNSTASGGSSDHDRAMDVLSGLDHEAESDMSTNNDVYAMVKESIDLTTEPNSMWNSAPMENPNTINIVENQQIQGTASGAVFISELFRFCQ